MEFVACEVCGSNNFEIKYQQPDLLHHVEGVFNIVQCKQCGLMYLNPRPTLSEIQKYYPQSYQPYAESTSIFSRWLESMGIQRRCQAVVQHCSRSYGRILDIGCATGNFLLAMQQQGWEAYGVEINEYVANKAKMDKGLSVFHGTLCDAHYPEHFFDVVTLWNVLEHLHHPKLTLQEIARIVQPSGLLVLAIPNPDALEAKLFGRYWAGLDTPRHLYIFPQRTIFRLLHLTGFQVVDVTTAITGRYSALALSFQIFIENTIKSPQVRRILNKLVHSIILRALLFPYYTLASYWNQGSVITIFATRR